MKGEETFAARLVRLRKEAGLSRYRLAKLTGLSAQALAYLESGSEPSWLTVRLLAHALGLPYSAFEVGPLPLPEPKPARPPGRPRKHPEPEKPKGKRRG
jgi:transcriptional regulator with XRE-family HTH domain